MTERTLDPRINAYRADLADQRLAGKVAADRFVIGQRGYVVRPAVGVRGAPGFDKPLVSEALMGEAVHVFDTTVGPEPRWSWIQQERDGYVGYVPADTITFRPMETTHRVSALGTWLYPEADIKAPPLAHVVLGSEICVKSLGERFAEIEGGAFIIIRHITEKNRFARDFVAVAERFLGTPYLWGGRTRLGLDCSGLVQVALEATGVPCPRDSDMQEAAVGERLATGGNFDSLDRGDLVFWPGHVGIMSDGVMLLHANAFHMSVVTEPLSNAVERISRGGSHVSAVKRISRSR